MRINFALPRFLFLLVLSGRASADPLPIEAFGKLPAETNPAISADGHWLAWIDQREENPRIVIFDILNHRVHRALAAPTAIRQIVWSNDSVLLILIRGTESNSASPNDTRTIYRFVALDAQEGPTRFLPLAKRDKLLVSVEARLLLARGAGPHSAIMFLPTYCHCTVSVDTKTGEFTTISIGKDPTIAWFVDRNGVPVLREDWDFKTHSYRLLVQKNDSDKPLELLRQSDNQALQVMGSTANGSGIVLLANNGLAHQAVWTLPLDGSRMQLLYQDPTADITNVFADPKTGAVTGIYVSGSVTTLRWLDHSMEMRQQALQRLFPGSEVWQAGWSDDASKILVQVQGPAVPPTYYLVDYLTHRADIAAEEYPALAGTKLGISQETTYPARDGTQIPAYVTRPPDASGPSSLVVLPHDGPARRDFLQFNWMVQFLVSRGYAVLQPQFRGSSGFGDAWLRAGFREWGGLMQDDVTDGVQAMIKLGIAEPKRVCVLGFGYGGYAALSGAAFTPDLYKCAISIGGIADLVAWVRDSKPRSFQDTNSNELVIKQRIGASGDPNLSSRSPVNAAKNIHIPLLLLNGTGDAAEFKQQSEHMADAMQQAGRPVMIDGFNTRVQMLHQIEDFLRDNL